MTKQEAISRAIADLEEATTLTWNVHDPVGMDRKLDQVCNRVAVVLADLRRLADEPTLATYEHVTVGVCLKHGHFKTTVADDCPVCAASKSSVRRCSEHGTNWHDRCDVCAEAQRP